MSTKVSITKFTVQVTVTGAQTPKMSSTLGNTRPAKMSTIRCDTRTSLGLIL